MSILSIVPLRTLAPLLTLALCCVVHLADPLPLQGLRNLVFDQYQRWFPRPYVDNPVRIVDIDDASLAELGQWPWPRPQVAALVERLHRAGATTIAFDVMFSEPDRTSPKTMLQWWKLAPGAAGMVAGLPDHDVLFANALRARHVVLGMAAVAAAGKPLPAMPFGTVIQGPAPDRLAVFSSAILPLPRFAAAAAGIGAMTFVPDADGVVRRVPLLLQVGSTVLPSLAAETLRVSQDTANYRIRTSERGDVEQVSIGRLSVPTTANGQAWVHFSKPEPRRTVSAAAFLAGRAGPEALRNSIVLVGTSAQGLQDLRFSPLGGIIPGVEVHAQFLEQALSGAYLKRPGWAPALETVVLLGGGLLICVVGLGLGAIFSATLTLALLGAMNWLAWQAFVDYRLLFDAATVSLGIAVVYAVASVIRHVASERRQRWVREAFSRYVSPNLVAFLVSHPDRLQLGGRRQPCSFVFTDLAGFTSLMEKNDPGAMVALLNDYLDEMIAIAFRHDGTLDRIVGDAVAIMFSAPVEQVDHPARALACALEMHRFASAYSSRQQQRGVAFGHTRIGVHCGEVVVGNFGGSTIFDYRALGDPVNTASRLESLNRHIGTKVCVSEAIREVCSDVPMREVGKVILKGKTTPLGIFEPVAASPMGDGVHADESYDTAFAALEAGGENARELFERLVKLRPEDGLAAFQLERLRRGEHGSLLVMDAK